MIPNIPILSDPIVDREHPNRTYKVELDKNRIKGYTDELQAVAQAVYFILGTERYQYVIYSWDYGVELLDLFGKPMPYVISELPRRIKEALTTDNRIMDVTGFTFEKNGRVLKTSFVVVSNAGDIPAEVEVEV